MPRRIYYAAWNMGIAMKKSIILVVAFFLALISAEGAGIDVTVIVSPVGGNLTLNNYVWEIIYANDGTTAYLNNNQGTMYVNSGSSKNFHISFGSQNEGVIKKGSDSIPYYLRVTLLTGNYNGVIGTPAIMSGFVQLTSEQTIACSRKTNGTIQFAIAMQILAASDFYESGTYTDILTITYAAP